MNRRRLRTTISRRQPESGFEIMWQYIVKLLSWLWKVIKYTAKIIRNVSKFVARAINVTIKVLARIFEAINRGLWKTFYWFFRNIWEVIKKLASWMRIGAKWLWKIIKICAKNLWAASKAMMKKVWNFLKADALRTRRDAKNFFRRFKKGAKKIVEAKSTILFWLLIAVSVAALIYGVKYSATITLFCLYVILLLLIAKRTMTKRNKPTVKGRHVINKIGFVRSFGIAYKKHFYWAVPVAIIFMAEFTAKYFA